MMSSLKSPVFTRSTVASQVADKLRLSIENGQWKYGQQLPNMRQLAERFEVSVSSAQEAVRQLAEDGVLELVPRQGSFVKMQVSDNILTGGQAQEIGVIRPLESPAGPDAESWKETILRAFELQLAEHGKHMTMLSYHPFKEDPLVQVCRRLDQCQDRLSGVVCLPSAWQEDLFKELDSRSIPRVAVGVPAHNDIYNFVAANYRGAGKQIGRCFGEQKRTNIWYLTDSFNIGISSKEKVAGLYEGLLDTDCLEPSIKVITCDGWRQPDGYSVVIKNIQQAREDDSKMPQAIFASGDFLAIGAMRACNELGLSVPGDVVVAGSTGTQAAHYTIPSLTVVAQPMEQMGKAAANMLIKMVETGQTKITGEHLPCELILRDSMPVQAQSSKSRFREWPDGSFVQTTLNPLVTSHNPTEDNFSVSSTSLSQKREYSTDNSNTPLTQEKNHDTHI